MHSRRLAAVLLAAAVIVPVGAAAAAGPDDVTLLRVFLTDGTSLVSYGEPARVSDRVIFSMPTATTPNPPLHLVNLPIAAGRLGSHHPIRGDRPRVALCRDPGGKRLCRAVQRRRVDVERSRGDGRAVSAARDRPARAPDAGGLAAEPFQLSRGRSAADARHARRGDCRSAGIAQSGAVLAVAHGVHRPARRSSSRCCRPRRRRGRRSSRC